MYNYTVLSFVCLGTSVSLAIPFKRATNYHFIQWNVYQLYVRAHCNTQHALCVYTVHIMIMAPVVNTHLVHMHGPGDINVLQVVDIYN